jgi:hypothetical protein
MLISAQIFSGARPNFSRRAERAEKKLKTLRKFILIGLAVLA